MKKDSFTLIEFLIVIALIAILGAIIGTTAFRTIEKSRCSRVVSESKTIKNAALTYYTDTGIWPHPYLLDTPINPFLSNKNDLGNPVQGWNGPYVEKWSPHPWGGHVGWDNTIDLDNNGMLDGCVILDDDRPGTGENDNQGEIPRRAMVKIDEMLDDGNLATGFVQGDGLGLHAGVGELFIIVVRDGQP